MPGVTPPQDVYVGESIPLRYSFLSLLKDFQDTNQSLTATVGCMGKPNTRPRHV